MIAVIADNTSVENKLNIPPPPEISERDMIQPVTLVPIIAPIIIEIA